MVTSTNVYYPTSQRAISWERADNELIYDSDNNEYIDFSSGCLIANCGFNNSFVKDEIINSLNSGLFTSYAFDNPWKSKLIDLLGELSPHTSPGVHLLNTGSEAIEMAIKISCFHNSTFNTNSGSAPGIVSFTNSFHGRTLGAQAIGGIPHLKRWIPSLPYEVYNIEYTSDPTVLRRQLDKLGDKNIAAIIFEPYMGGSLDIFSTDDICIMKEFCIEHNALLIADEIQSGCFRTGHFLYSCRGKAIPDVIALGKGVSSSLPLSCILASEEIFRSIPSSEISSTHSGNPIVCASAYGNLRFMTSGNIGNRVQSLEQVVRAKLEPIANEFPNFKVSGVGLAFAIDTNDPQLSQLIVNSCIDNGLMLFNPVGHNGSTIKLVPPLTIGINYLQSGLEILSSVIHLHSS